MCSLTVLLKTGLLLILSPLSTSSLTVATTAWPDTATVDNLQTTYVGSTSVGFSWEAPANSTFTGYVVFVNLHGRCQYGIYILCPPEDTVYVQGSSCNTVRTGRVACEDVVFFNVTELLPYTVYHFNVAATNKYIVYENSTVDAMTKVGIPAPPSNVLVRPLNNSAFLVEWTIPSQYVGPTSYIIRVLEAADRNPSTNYKPIATYRVDGYNMTSCVVVNLLSWWRYRVDVASSSQVGMSIRTTSATATTLQSGPGAVQNLSVSYVTDHYMTVMVSWECPLERERNAQITNYTVQYIAYISLTVTSGSYYPEDPCTDLHRVLLPVLPYVNYSITVFANAEFMGKNNSIDFYVDLKKMMLPSTSNDLSTETNPSLAIIVSATSGSIIAVLLTMIVVLYFFGKRARFKKRTS